MSVSSSAPVQAGTHVPTIVLCVLAAFCEGVDLQVAGVAAPGISGELEPSPALLGYFFSASTFGLLLGALAGGYLADRIGRKRVLVFSVAVFGVLSLLTVDASTVDSLIVLRFFTGLGLGGAYPNMIALTSEASAANRRHANVALVYAGTPAGGALISLGSSMMAPAHWRWLFGLGGIAPLITVPAMALYLRESAQFLSRRSAAASESRVTPGFVALLQDGRASRTLLLWLTFILALIVQYLLLSWLPTLLVGIGLSKAQAAAAQIGFNLGGATAALVMGRLLEGPWRRPAVLMAFFSLPVLMLLLANAAPQVMLVTIISTGIGCSILSALAFLYATAPLCYPTEIRGTGVGAAVGAGRIGSVIGPLIGGALVTAGHSSGRLLVDLLPIAMIAALCAILVLMFKPID